MRIFELRRRMIVLIDGKKLEVGGNGIDLKTFYGEDLGT
jgi:hypothetical protein